MKPKSEFSNYTTDELKIEMQCIANRLNDLANHIQDLPASDKNLLETGRKTVKQGLMNIMRAIK